MIGSFFTSTLRILDYVNALEKHTLNLKEKFTLVMFFAFTIFSRTYACIISLTMPALNFNYFLQGSLQP